MTGFELGYLTSSEQMGISGDDTSRVLEEALILDFHLGTQNEHKWKEAALADSPKCEKYVLNFEFC